ncbi:MAG: nucleotidyltransferase domain-containing protein [Clostridia bacterium]|nr:nucleotidyltransferase domain-containing protein [Clostridia bacterium]
MTTSTKKNLIMQYKEKYPLLFAEHASDNLLLSKRYEAAWKVAKKAAAVLKDGYAAKKVVVFGSLTSRSSFNHWSDIDLAVWGIPDEKFFAAVGAVTSLSSEFKIDLVDAEDCRISLCKAIEEKGIEL